jgi:hypothetical protein
LFFFTLKVKRRVDNTIRLVAIPHIFLFSDSFQNVSFAVR